MTWVIIIILILIALFVISNQKHNIAIEKQNLNNGGLRKSFPTFTNHLENFYDMTFTIDTGRDFTYSKVINDSNGNKGQLMIGVKLNMLDDPLIFTKFRSKYNGEFLGLDVTGINFDSIKSIDKCINISHKVLLMILRTLLQIIILQ